jgi:SAM-dependent methyltransferase
MRFWIPSKAGSPGRRIRRGFVTWVLDAFLRRYAACEAEAVASFVIGRRALDLGAGEGYVAGALRRRIGAWICSVDVGPFRRAGGPYVMYDGAQLPFGALTFETTLLLLALHHCVAPDAVLREAVRVTRRRLIVMESVYRNRWESFWLHRLDRWLNGYRHDGEMTIPLAFRSPSQWSALLESLGLRVVAQRWPGSWWEHLVHRPLLLVADRTQQPSPRSALAEVSHG